MGVQCYELFGGTALKIHTFSLILLDFTLIGLTVVRFKLTKGTGVPKNYAL